MGKRSTEDPLLRLFLDRYHVNLLAVPREGIDVGDAYVDQGGVISAPGRITQVLIPRFELPSISRGERLADITGNATRRVERRAAVRVLDNLMVGLGISLGVSAHAAFERGGGMSFHFHEVTRDSVDVLEIGRMLPEYRLDPSNAALDAASRIFVTTAVLFTSTISLELEQSAGVDVATDLNNALASAGVGIKAEGDTRVTLKAEQPLGFGVELHELTFGDGNGRPTWKRTAVPIPVRGTTVVRQRVTPATIGGPEDDIFLTIV